MQRYTAASIICIVLCWAHLSVVIAQQSPPAGQDVSAESLLSDMTDIHDLKSLEPPQGMPFSTKLLLVLFAILATISCFGGVYRYYRKRVEEKQKTPPPVPPEQAAYDALKEIGRLMDSDGKAFYFRLSLAFREYIGKRFSINAAEMTTEELFPVLRSLPLEKDLVSDTSRFFDYSDPVKYAGAVPERTKMERHLKLVRSFVKKTTEAILPEPDGAGIVSLHEKATGAA